MKRVLFILTAACLLAGCSTLRTPTVEVTGNINKYIYVYIIPTSGVTASSGMYSNQYGVYGGSTKTVNPSEVISGFLMKQGYTILPSIDPNLTDYTMIVSYGYTGRRQLTAFSYASGVMMQFRDAKTHELVASCEGEGCGEDETADILQAIYRALEALFPKN